MLNKKQIKDQVKMFTRLRDDLDERINEILKDDYDPSALLIQHYHLTCGIILGMGYVINENNNEE